ncbi:MAG: AbrB/MazE/SpoVT family DNA-binding domain-containing protein [Methanobacteriota archaeon]|nr:MAG: AbrB/MazE/SpoVT family DNA-binding domain-containing protein [Euryarchaeota archaeon]
MQALERQVVIPKDVRKRHGLERDTDLVLTEEGNALGLRKKADIEKVLRNLSYPLLRAAEKSLAELWENPEDDAWKGA